MLGFWSLFTIFISTSRYYFSFACIVVQNLYSKRLEIHYGHWKSFHSPIFQTHQLHAPTRAAATPMCRTDVYNGNLNFNHRYANISWILFQAVVTLTILTAIIEQGVCWQYPYRTKPVDIIVLPVTSTQAMYAACRRINVCDHCMHREVRQLCKAVEPRWYVACWCIFLAATSHFHGPDLKPIDSYVLCSHLMHSHSVMLLHFTL